MASFTLDDIRTAAEVKYGSTNIELGNGETVILRNALRMPKGERDQLVSIQERLDAEDADHVVLLSEALVLVAENKDVARRMLDSIGDDLGLVVAIFDKYSKGTEAGEA